MDNRRRDHYFNQRADSQGQGSGTYTIKVKYDNGSTHCEKEASIDFDAPDKLEGIMSADGTANCKPDSVNISVNMTSGSGVYTYDWSPAGDILFGLGSESVVVNKANSYKVTITDVTSGCKLELEKTVNADTISPVVSITGDTILDCLRKQANLLSSIPDTSKYLLDWKLPDASGRHQSPNIQSGQTGTYQLVIQDKKNKCTDTAYWNVKTDTLRPIVQLGSDLTIDCIQDIVEIIPNVTNNPSSVRYFWTLANGQNVIEDSLKNKFAGTGGKVILRIVNQANGCASADTLIVQDTRAFPSLSLINPDTITCSKTSVGLDAQSNNSNLRIQWRTQGGIINGSNSNLKAVAAKRGIYYIMIEDTTNHCSITDSVEVFENIIKPDAVLGNDLILKCSDSTITIDGSASSSGVQFKFEWSTPDGKIRGSNSGSQVIVDKAGQYFLILTDLSNNCMDTAQINVINDANKPSVTVDQADSLTCARMLITLNAKASATTGGNLSYQWTSDLGQPVNRANQPNPDIILPGKYNIIVTDQSNGCTAESSVSVSIDTVRPKVNAGPDLKLDCNITSVKANGSANATGNQPIYLWSTINGKFVGTGDPKDIVITGAGIYKLEVTAGNGCTNTDEISVAIDTVKPTSIILIPDTLTCSKNQVDLNSTGSSTGARYQYLWTTVNGKLNGDSSLNMVKASLAGRYQLKITDTINHCESSASIQVAEDRRIPSLLLDVPIDLTCKIRSVVLKGNIIGTPPFQLLWSGPAGGLSGNNNGFQANATKAGWYVLSVTGRNGCSVIDSVQVSEITNVPTNVETSLDQPHCQGDIASLNKILVTGGIGPYQYELDGNIISGLPVSNLSPGLHTLKVLDKNGCETSNNFTIDQPSAVSVSLPPSASVDAGNGLTLNFTTTIPADSIASIEWSPSDKLSCTDCPNPTTTALDEETVFTVTITNKNGCTATASIRIQVIKRGIWVPDVFSPNGDGINDYFYPVAAPGSYKQVRLLQIFDRWGELVFHKENFQPNLDIEGWNGQFKGVGLNPGVYVYQLILEWNNGELANLQGDVSLIR
ncbi:MAG: gliding motility-associated C-terminal domain-containing protein [Saprospiraceae bacterium]|nr:gliding motility-associated C-terminal domain-containing protein [Saprospiraceae bacterium]